MLKKVAILIACIATFAFAQAPSAEHGAMAAMDANLSNAVNINGSIKLKRILSYHL